jgi:hypothetical protein
MKVEDIAEACHEANRVLQRALDEPVNPPWVEAPEELRRSVVNGVENALRGATPEESHENWLKFKEAEGWSYGETKDFEARTHPCFAPYDELPEDQKVKDHLFTSIVRTLEPLVEEMPG